MKKRTVRLQYWLLITERFGGLRDQPRWTERCSESDQGFRVLRSTTSGFRATWLLARSLGENIVNRPVSHISSLLSLALKSTGGAIAARHDRHFSNARA